MAAARMITPPITPPTMAPVRELPEAAADTGRGVTDDVAEVLAEVAMRLVPDVGAAVLEEDDVDEDGVGTVSVDVRMQDTDAEEQLTESTAIEEPTCMYCAQQSITWADWHE